MQQVQWLQENFRFGLFVRQIAHARSSPAATSVINLTGNGGLPAGADARYSVLGIGIGGIGAATAIGNRNGEPGRGGCGCAGCGGCGCGCGRPRHICLAAANASSVRAAISCV